MYQENKQGSVRIVSKSRFYGFLTIVILLIVLLITSIYRFTEAEEILLNNEMVYIQEGDTIWSIAAEYKDSNTDIRKYIYQLRKVNNMDSTDIFPGNIIILPIMN